MCNIIITLYQLADGEEGMLLYKTRYSSYKIWITYMILK